MLLRRFSEHVKDQNWFAVALDFVIVLGGVLLAFQLQAWGERRAAAERADQSLHQLYEESEEALRFWVRQVAGENRRLAFQDQVIAALYAGDPGELADDDIAGALAGIGRYPTLSPPRRTYDELSNAGLLREIDAPEAMGAVATYYEDVAFIQGQINFFRPSGTREDDILNAGLASVYDPTRWARQRIEADFAALAADSEYLETVVEEYRNMMMFQIYRRETMHDAAAMCTALAAAVGETCEGLANYEEYAELPEWQMRLVPHREEQSEDD
jgi:hypothetical protein